MTLTPAFSRSLFLALTFIFVTGCNKPSDNSSLYSDDNKKPKVNKVDASTHADPKEIGSLLIKVYDEITNQLIAGPVIYIDSNNYCTASTCNRISVKTEKNQTSAYSPRLNAGSYRVGANYPGYVANSTDVDVVGGETTEVVIKLIKFK